MSRRGRAGDGGTAAGMPGSGERAARRQGRRPSADVAVVLAILVPGLGHLHAGRPRAAALWLLAILAGYWAFYWAGLALHGLSLFAARRAVARGAGR